MYLQKLINKRLYDDVVYFYKYICIYIYLSVNQPGHCEITQSYTLNQPHMGIKCKYNQYAFLNLIVGDKQNYVGILDARNKNENMKIHVRKSLHEY